jgi:HPt (histidine-containing phosphotransfer) domain-containing protein
MIQNAKFTLLVDYEEDLKPFNLGDLNDLFTVVDKDSDVMMYDAIYLPKQKELIHDFNKELILKNDDFSKLSNKVKQEINEKIKQFDFNLSFALEMLGGSKKALSNIFKSYLEEYINIDVTLLDLLSKNDFEGIRKIIHKIKGSSAYIGSEKLMYLAEILEYRIYNDLAIKENIIEFLKYHSRIFEYVKAQV